MIALPAVQNTIRVEVAMFVAHAFSWAASNPDALDDILFLPESMTPAPVARNRIVKAAQIKKADFLLMIDDDTCPPLGFFETAVKFLMASPGNAIAAPYCCGPPSEDVLAFEMYTQQSDTAESPWKLTRITREDAARRTGIQRVANIGTGCIMYDMEVFNKIKPPYYDYTYNEDHTVVEETEDCQAHRRLNTHGCGIYVSWDHWALHQKNKTVGKPTPLTQKMIDEMYLREARAELAPLIRKEIEDKIRLEITEAENVVKAKRQALGSILEKTSAKGEANPAGFDRFPGATRILSNFTDELRTHQAERAELSIENDGKGGMTARLPKRRSTETVLKDFPELREPFERAGMVAKEVNGETHKESCK